jgi:hypothetical protein
MQYVPRGRRILYTARLIAVLALILVGTGAVAQLNCNVGVEFYVDGGIKSCNLNGNHRIYNARGQPLTCLNGYRLVQYPDGRLQSCTLAEPARFDATLCARLSVVEFNPDGTLRKCVRS